MASAEWNLKQIIWIIWITKIIKSSLQTDVQISTVGEASDQHTNNTKQ